MAWPSPRTFQYLRRHCNDPEIACGAQGCSDPEACNFDPEAEFDDGSCQFPAPYYDCLGNCLNDGDDDSVCDELEVPGCLEPNACNFMGNHRRSRVHLHSAGGLRLRRKPVGCLGHLRRGCLADGDNDGICDDVDPCVGTYDDCGVCNGPGPFTSVTARKSLRGIAIATATPWMPWACAAAAVSPTATATRSATTWIRA